MNTHNTINKQREKILLSGVAAAALGLINAKPQTVKAASQNGTRTTKKTARRAVKTKLNYQSDMTKTSAEAVTNDENSGNQSNNVGAVNSNLETGQHQASVVNNNNSILTETNQDEAAVNEKTDEQETDPIKFVAAKASRESNTSVSSTWNDIPVSFNNGVLSLGEKDKDYSIDNTAEKEIGINNNINNINTDNITEIDILGKITINGPADSLFDTLPNLTQINGLNNFITSDVTDMSYMFADCPKLVSLDLSSFDTSKVTFFSSMFYADTDLSSVNLSSFTITDDAVDYSLFDSCTNLTKLVLGKGIKFTTTNDLPNDSLQQPGTWVNMGEGNSSLTKGTNQWSSADLMTNYQGDRDHDTYIRYTGGTVTVHRQDEDSNQLVDQEGKQIPDEKLFGNISDPVTVDTSKEIAGYTFKENQNSDVKAFTSDPQDITLVYSKSKTDNTWEGVPYTFNNGVLSLGEKGKTYTINNSDNKDISIFNNISNVAGTDITEIDINAPIAIIGSAEILFYRLLNLTTINGLNKLDTSKVTNMKQMFMSCTKMTSLDLSSFDTTNVTSFNTMFASDPNLTSVDLSSFTVSDNATTMGMFALSKQLTSSLSKLILGKGFKFTTSNDRPNNSLQQPGTWINMGEDNGSLTKGTNQWSSADLMTNYQGDRDHDTYVRYTGGIVTIHRQDEDGKQLVDQDGKQIPDEKLFGNISDPVTVDTSKEFAGYTFKENKNSNVKAFTSDPQDITLVYSKSKTDNTSDNTWEGVPYTFNNGVLSLGAKGKNYKIDNSGNKEKSYALDTRDISLSQNIKGVNVDEIKEIDLNANIKIIGSANGLFKNLKNLATIKGLSNLDTSQVTDFSLMFSGDTALTSADLSNFQVADTAAAMTDMFSSCSSLTKLTLGTGFMFIGSTGLNDLSGTWINMGAGEGSPAKGTNQWTSADLITNYHGDTNHDIYVRFTNLGGKITINYRDQDGKEIPGVPAEVNFGNENDKLINDDPVTTFKLKDTLKDSSGTEYQFDHAVQNNSRITLSDVTYSASANPQDITLVYTKKTGTGSNGSGSNGSGSNGSGSNGSGSNGSGSNGSGSNGSGNSTPNTSVPNNTNSSSGNNGSVNNPSSSNSQGSNSQGSNTGNSNNNSSSASNGQNNGNNLPNNEPNNIPSPVNRKPKTVKPHKTINKGFNIKDQNAIHNQQLANSLKNSGSSSNAQNSASNTLPQTGNDKHNSLAMLALGSLALATALGAAWFGRKKD
ncbi:BspA family leucine-rich repeat surface protein [Lactobacillus sp. IBH004]|uniref:BspA family leucine-rich repeat surface protein n=1 Tax=Lactobacillus sp. IBH004 TaxID=2879107 RepID=UPI002243DB0D|nr:BspA family leucine-rich repeat surface protein [Lactobacillus sp. IBH004]UZN42450.1 BspA family leucine-rich repeat surface protein [Lactobacillus sp. IBH004]